MAKNIIISLKSLLIILVGALVIYLIAIFSQDAREVGFSLSLFYIIGFGTSFIAGLIVITLLFLRLYKSGLSSIFNFIGVSNLVFGIWGIFTNLTHQTTDNGLLPYLGVSTIIGIFILRKTYKIKES